MAIRRLSLKAALCGLITSLLAAAWIQPAHAWTWSRDVVVYQGPGLCVKGTAGIDHFRPGAFSGNLAYATAYAFDATCRVALNRPGNLAAVRLDVYRWSGSAWQVCRSTNWQYGPTGTSGGDVGGPYGPSQVYDYGGSASCGAGYYGTLAHAYAWDGSAWRGGGVWSGYEYVP